MKQRVLTALVLAPLVLGACLLSSPYPLVVLCLLAATIGFAELRKLLCSQLVLPVLTLASVAGPFYAEQMHLRERGELLPFVFLFFLFGVGFAWFSARRGQARPAELDIAGLWITMPLVSILFVHDQFAKGIFFWKNPVFLLLLPVWGGDIAAMLVGKVAGKHLLWPSISPGKTWEGAIANLVAAIAVAYGVGTGIGLSADLSLACGLATGIFGQLGDLFESYVKRRAGAKDSGAILPGHGGLLDRIDGLLFAAPVVAMLMLFWHMIRQATGNRI